MKKFFILSLVTLTASTSLFGLTLTPVGAQSAQTSSTASAAAFKSARRAERCGRATARIAKITQRYKDKREHYATRYDRIIERLIQVIAKLNDKGINPGTLPASLQAIKDKQVNFKAQVSTAIAALEATKQFACGDSEGKFREAFLTAKEELLQVRTIALEVKRYIVDNVVSEIKALRDQIANS
jgi:hypothetical protein